MKFAEENSFDIKDKIKADVPVILPIGAIEAHGGHLPLNTDNILAEKYADKLAEKTNGFVLPVLPFGQVWSLRDFPGSLTLSNATLSALVSEIGVSLYQQGFRIFVIFSAHLGNMTALKDAGRNLYDQFPDMKVMYIFYPELQSLAAEVRESSANHHTYVHADEIETSLMLYLSPEDVNMERAIDDPPILPEDSDYTPTPWQKFTSTAVLGEATLATAKKGEFLIERTLEKSVEIVEKAKKEIREK